METRVQLNSKTYNIDVFKKFPSLDIQKSYVLKVESAHIPAVDTGLIANEPLFTLERRFLDDTEYKENEARFDTDMSFTPQNVRTGTQLVFQINKFLDRAILKLLTSGELNNNNNDLADVPDNFNIDLALPEQNDWYTLLLDGTVVLDDATQVSQIEKCLRCILRTDGRIGFRFTPDAWSFFVIRLTDSAKRIFGFEHDSVAIDENGQFTAYLDDGDTHTTPPVSEENYTLFFDNSIFSNEKYRHEIVVTTTLPLQPYIDCDSTHATFQSQLCTYRYPNNTLKEEYFDTYFKRITEARDRNFVFEHANKTHNLFVLKGTQLQNFHVKLLLRSYEYDFNSNKYKRVEINYPLIDDAFWSITLNVRAI